MAKGIKYGGRTKGTPNKKRDEIRDLIDKAGKRHGGMQKMFSRLFELGNGVLVEKEITPEHSIVYAKPPDSYAIKILAEYYYGKPAQVIEGTGEGGSIPLSLTAETINDIANRFFPKS